MKSLTKFFSRDAEKLLYFAIMLEDLKLTSEYDGFLFLAESTRNPPSLKSHHHVELELNLVAKGHITYVYRGKRYSFAARSLIWLFPSQDHQLVDRSADAQNYVAVFKPEMIERSCRSPAYRELKRKRTPGDVVLHCDLDPGTFDFLRKLMDQVMEGSLDPDLLNREAGFGINPDFRYRHADPDSLNAGLHHLLIFCWRLQCAAANQRSPVALHPSVSKAIEILSHTQWEGQLPELSRECGLSEAHLSRIFAQQVGVSLNRYRNSIRLGRFWEHYRKTVRPTIMEAAFSAGFGSYAQFYKIFTDAYGKGPRECLRDH